MQNVSTALNYVESQIPGLSIGLGRNLHGSPGERGLLLLLLGESRGKAAEPLTNEAPGFRTCSNVGCVDQGDHGDRLTLFLKLTGDLEGDDSSGAHASHEIGAMRLNRLHLANVVGSHLGDARMENGVVFTAIGLKSVDGMVRIETEGQVSIEHRLAFTVVDQEQGRFLSSRANQY